MSVHVHDVSGRCDGDPVRLLDRCDARGTIVITGFAGDDAEGPVVELDPEDDVIPDLVHIQGPVRKYVVRVALAGQLGQLEQLPGGAAAVVHVMQPAIRQYYQLEEIWGDKPVALKRKAASGGLAKASEPIDEDEADEAPAKPRKAAGKTTAARKAATEAPPRKVAAKKAAAKTATKAAPKAAGKPAAARR